MALMFERERKKRRFNLNLNQNQNQNQNHRENDNINDDSDSEDMKMDMFFALIRSRKDLRDQILGIEVPRVSEKKQQESKTQLTVNRNKEEKLKAAAIVQETSTEPEEDDLTAVNNTDVPGTSRRSSEEYSPNKPSDHTKLNVEDGRFLLDLNLSL